jgi:predicted alpha/beta hydrolase family esterase
MKNAVLLHGTCSEKHYYSEDYPSLSNAHWFPWVQKQLLIRDIPTATPDMVRAHQPDYRLWKKELERFDITPETMLVGHSCGGGFLVRWLSEQSDTKVGKVVLVAPWLDPNNKKANDFFDFEIDADLVERTAGVTIFHSPDDDTTVQVSVDRLIEKINNLKVVTFPGYGHFMVQQMGTETFPELVTELLS